MVENVAMKGKKGEEHSSVCDRGGKEREKSGGVS